MLRIIFGSWRIPHSSVYINLCGYISFNYILILYLETSFQFHIELNAVDANLFLNTLKPPVMPHICYKASINMQQTYDSVRWERWKQEFESSLRGGSSLWYVLRFLFHSGNSVGSHSNWPWSLFRTFSPPNLLVLKACLESGCCFITSLNSDSPKIPFWKITPEFWGSSGTGKEDRIGSGRLERADKEKRKK